MTRIGLLSDTHNFVDDALLHPDGLRQGREAQGLFDDGKYIGGVSENIDDIDLTVTVDVEGLAFFVTVYVKVA